MNVSSAVAESSKLAPSERLDKLIDLHWRWTLDESPELATYAGEPGYDNRWGERTLEAVARRADGGRALLSAFEEIQRDGLDDDRRLNRDLIVRALRLDDEAARFPGELLQLGLSSGPQSSVPHILGIMPGSRQGAEDMLERLRGVPSLLEQVTDLLREGIRRGVTSPQVVLEEVPAQIEMVLDESESNPLIRPFISMHGSDNPELAQEAATVVRKEAVPAFRNFHEFVTRTYVPAARSGISLGDLPEGRDWYQHLVRVYTTTEITPEEVHEIGHAQVARLREQMSETQSLAGHAGDLTEFAEFLRSDERFFFQEAHQLVTAYRDISKRADAQLPALFGRLPQLTYGVEPIPEYVAKTATTAYYMPGSMKAGRAATYFVNTYDLSSRPKWEMEALSLHEAVPGHHLQIALAQELEGLPSFRRHSFETAYIEGWALYAESLGEQMGFYQDPYSKFGQLTYQMWRAIRLVVDTGMHALGWTREQAIEFFNANSTKSLHDIGVEIDRYISVPGQALAYKIGELRITEIRSEAERSLGDSFDVRGFHDALLGAGALPLDLLTERMRRWIQAQQT